MRRKFFSCFVRWGALLALAPLGLFAASKPVLVHYMPWFVAKPFSPDWGWHWTMNHSNPDAFNSGGQRDLAAFYYPAIGPYDSADPMVLEYHVLLMKLSGIDGVIVDWYGMDDFADYAVNEQRTAALFTYTKRAGLKFALCYEDRTILNELNAHYINAGTTIAHAQKTMLYAQTNYFNDPSYLRWNSRPVLLNFGPEYFKVNGDWQAILAVLDPTNQPAFFTENSRLPIAVGAFDWPPMWLSQATGGILNRQQLGDYLNGFERTAAAAPAWPAYVSSAFPRFHDFYQQADVGPSNGYLADDDGAVFRETLERGLTNQSALVQIVTWNDFGEGTIVEPTLEYGFRDLGVIQEARRRYVDRNFGHHTNDLVLASRLLSLRRQYASDQLITAELARVFSSLLDGGLADGERQLSGVESGVPMIYGLSFNGSELRFSVGGYLSPSGLELQTAATLEPAAWRGLDTLPASTNLSVFRVAMRASDRPAFFRVRAAQ